MLKLHVQKHQSLESNQTFLRETCEDGNLQLVKIIKMIIKIIMIIIKIIMIVIIYAELQYLIEFSGPPRNIDNLCPVDLFCSALLCNVQTVPHRAMFTSNEN